MRIRIPYWSICALAGLVRCVRYTWRLHVVDPGNWLQTLEPSPIIAPLWHNRILLLADFFPRRVRHNALALASASRDGEMAAHALRAFGFGAVRGSSSRRGYEALYGLKRGLQEGRNVALTVDGPRGPRYRVQPGVVLLAEWTGAPIVPVGFNAPRRWETRAWDRTQIPKPFARVSFHVGLPLWVKPNLTPEEREAECARVTAAMQQITDDART